MSSLFEPALAGFLIGASLLIAIGPQNALVLHQGLLKHHVFPIALFCSLSDALLIALGVGGLGAVATHHQTALLVIEAGGAIFLFFYGLKSFRRAIKGQVFQENRQAEPSLVKNLMICAGFTWGNPHVYIDTVLLIGSLSVAYQDGDRLVYALGAMLASFVWFFALGYGARLLIPLFRHPVTWKILDLIIGLMVWVMAGRLVFIMLT